MDRQELDELKVVYPEMWEAYKKANPDNAEHLFARWVIPSTPEGEAIMDRYLIGMGWKKWLKSKKKSGT